MGRILAPESQTRGFTKNAHNSSEQMSKVLHSVLRKQTIEFKLWKLHFVAHAC